MYVYTENAYRYSYGRQANKTLKDIMIPDDVPQWVKENKYNQFPRKLVVKNWIKYSKLEKLSDGLFIWFC